MTHNFKLTLAVAAMVLLAGCSVGSPDVSEKTPEPQVGERLGDAPNGGTYRVIDDEAGVVCYYIDDHGSSGEAMSCLPINETRLAP